MRRRKGLPEQKGEPRASTAERLESIVEAAERAAESVIDDAEEQGRRYLAEARARADAEAARRRDSLAELTGPLLDQASDLRARAEHLEAAVEQLRSRLEALAVDVPEEAEERRGRTPHLIAVEPVADAEPEPPGQTPAGARLLATQMAVSGHSREEIEQRLRNGFQIEDTTAILDAILGPEE
jgi:hypothetical protein